jgi:hypothetical protein
VFNKNNQKEATKPRCSTIGDWLNTESLSLKIDIVQQDATREYCWVSNSKTALLKEGPLSSHI